MQQKGALQIVCSVADTFVAGGGYALKGAFRKAPSLHFCWVALVEESARFYLLFSQGYM